MTAPATANAAKFYIDGRWVEPDSPERLDVINPATEEPIATIALGSERDVDAAIAAAAQAFPSFSKTTVKERVELLNNVVGNLQAHSEEMAATISAEMGAPTWLAQLAQAPAGLGHFATTAAVLENFEFEESLGTTLLRREPVGVVAMITPWNWPLNQVACKVAPALAAGCTMVLKPSEVAPLSGLLLAKILDESGVPPGVFNLVNGDGATVGARLSSHPSVDMVSFTGSTRAGVEVARAAAPTVKRVAQELGGKSANIILDDANLEEVIARDVNGMCVNSGQSCNAGTRMLVPADRLDDASEVARQAMEAVKVDSPDAEGSFMGPVASEAHWNRVQSMIQQGIDEGATLVTGGVGRPEGLDKGFFVKPTLFSDVDNTMTIAREEIFGPVLVLIPYEDVDDAIRIANDSAYGLAGYVSGSHDRALDVARQIRTGNMHVNGAPPDFNAPFGGYKQSGNGREWGRLGLEEFLETKAIMGANV
ncbi:MAG: aldehyde dehydrogenase family protein [Ilumatobacteraceae bacterium]